MNLTAGGKVTLNPKIKEERVALRVLQLINGDEKLDEIIKQNIKAGGSNVDCTLNSGEDQGEQRKFLDFFKDEKFDVISVVFRWVDKDAKN